MYTLTLTKYGEPKEDTPQTTNIEEKFTWEIQSEIEPSIIQDIYNDFSINKLYDFSNDKGFEVDSDIKHLEPHVRVSLLDKNGEPQKTISYKTESFKDLYQFINNRIEKDSRG